MLRLGLALLLVPGLVLVAPTSAPSSLAAPAPVSAPPQSSVPASAAVGRAGWVWPVQGPPAFARGYEAPATRYGAGHRGIDLEVGVGGEVRAPADGTVAFVGQVAGRPVVALEHDGGYRSSLEPVSSSLAVGDRVERAQPIGVVVDGGHCAGCLHFGVRLHGEYLDPRALIVGIPRAVLLPA
ncbi:M23 family metallopeptidase [Cnuibacter physcomitrellae]|uniref:murein hydrolase activator EnvC family protein n=1 Tax=Cnuibacter physcomitrellae TaxID=1619308 RepID=UPI002175A589|nr:M23 family metallopeptidase [Cnuibacter physcomitrellae]MCS5499045.1 M23 family metallopeptidase [Cnuibacter physcomitrellae]